MMIFLVCQIMFSEKAELLSNDTLQQLLRNFTTAVAIVIVSVPEGLSLAVSIAMAFSISKMKDQQLLVKKMAATESLAYTANICTGKTGTITTGDMKVKGYWIGVFDEYNNKDKKFNVCPFNSTLTKLIINNNDAKIEMACEEEYEQA